MVAGPGCRSHSQVLVGNVQGKKALLIDDMTDTAGTLTLAAKQLLEFGATEVYAAVMHGAGAAKLATDEEAHSSPRPSAANATG